MLMIKPSLAEVYWFLNKMRDLLVHFSGIPKGAGESNFFPDDLRKVISGECVGGVSCLLIIPSDYYSDERDEGNAVGMIGVILDIDESGIVAGSPSDCGSHLN